MDAGIYVRTVGGNKVYATIYVDDILNVGTESDIDMVTAKLRSKFKIKNGGHVKHSFRMEISYIPGSGCQFHSTTY